MPIRDGNPIPRGNPIPESYEHIVPITYAYPIRVTYTNTESCPDTFAFPYGWPVRHLPVAHEDRGDDVLGGGAVSTERG